MKTKQIKSRVVKREVKEPPPPPPVFAKLDPEAERKLNAIAFKQEQIKSRTDVMETSFAVLSKSVVDMFDMVRVQLERIRQPQQKMEPVFCRKIFNKISLRLRKKTIDVQVEDIHQGIKRRRVFRCSDWTRVEHFLVTQAMGDGIEELEVKPPARRKGKEKPKPVKGRFKRASIPAVPKATALAEVRHVMERDGIPNTVISGDERKARWMDTAKDKAQRGFNRSREKAEKVIVKLCSPGGPAEGATGKELLDALEANGFGRDVAYWAAANCGRVGDPKLAPAGRKQAATTSNVY